MQISQFNMQYDPEQDRIVFRLNTAGREEMRFFLTRRFVKLLWPVLIDAMVRNYKQREPDKSYIAGIMLPFEHSKIVSDGDFQTEYARQAEDFPLGEEAILLSQIKLKQAADGHILCLHPRKGTGVELKMREKLLHSFCKLLRDCVGKAGWDLEALLNEDLTAFGSTTPGQRMV